MPIVQGISVMLKCFPEVDPSCSLVYLEGIFVFIATAQVFSTNTLKLMF